MKPAIHLISTVVAAALLIPASALAERERADGVGAQAAARDADFITTPEHDQLSASALIGHTLHTTDGREIGEVTDLLLDRDGRVAGVIVHVGDALAQRRQAITDERAERRAARATEQRYERERDPAGLAVRDDREIALRWEAVELTIENDEPHARAHVDPQTLLQARAFQARDDREAFARAPQRRDVAAAEREPAREARRAAEPRRDVRGEAAILEAQERGHFVAQDLIGRTVRSADDQEVGEITDLLLDRQGRAVGVIVHVDEALPVGRRALTDERAERRAALATEERYERDRDPDVAGLTVRDENEIALRWDAIEFAIENEEPFVRAHLDADTMARARAFETRDAREVFARMPEAPGVAAAERERERERAREHQPDRPVAERDDPRAARTPTVGMDAFVTQQQQQQHTADELMGRPVIGADGDEIGNVDDVLMDRDGNVVAVIVGVGGFLGIGERDVAMRWDALEITTDEDGEPLVRIDVDRQTLETAPEFQRVEDR